MAGSACRSPSNVLIDTPSALDRTIERGHRGLALARFEPREVGDGQVGPLGHLIERQAGPGPCISDARSDQRQYLIELHRAMMRQTCLGGKRSCQSLRIGNTGETVR